MYQQRILQHGFPLLLLVLCLRNLVLPFLALRTLLILWPSKVLILHPWILTLLNGYIFIMILISAVFLNVTFLLGTSLWFRFRVVKVGFFPLGLFSLCLIPTQSLALRFETSFENPLLDGNDEGPELPVAPVQTELTDVNEEFSLQFQCNDFGEVVLFISVFQNASRYCDRLSICRFVLTYVSTAFRSWLEKAVLSGWRLSELGSPLALLGWKRSGLVPYL